MRRHARQTVHDFTEHCFTDAAGRTLVQAPVHRALQDFLAAHRHALIELPRDHGKSVQACIRLLWELGRNPALRIKLVCATAERAAERVRFLRGALADGGMVRHVFPHLARSRPWTQTSFTIQRPANVIGPSVVAFGVGGGSTGTRADLLLCDDLVDVRSLNSPSVRARVKSFFYENLLNLLEPDGRCWCLCTPWHRDDLNADLKRNPAFAHFRRAVGPDAEPVWPEHWPRERLLARKEEIGSLAFTRAYRLECLSEEDAVIKPAWIRFWDCRLQIADRRLPETGASANLQSTISNLQSLYERVILAVDPAVSTKSSADRTALVTLGQTANHEIHVLEATARRVAAPELVYLLDQADQRWTPDTIVFESNAAFAGLRDLLLRHATFGPKIKSVTQTKDKLSRLHAFSVPVENGAFRLKGSNGHVDAGQQELWDELTGFPAAEHDDLADAAAMGTAYLLERPEPRVW